MRNCLHKRPITLFIMVLFLINAFYPAYADELDDKQQELDSVNQQMESQQYLVDQASKQQKSILGQIQDLDNNMNKTQKDINSTNYSLNQLKGTIKQTEQEINQKQLAISQQTDTLGERLVYIYEGGTVSYLQVLLASTSINDFLTRYDMLKAIVDEDVRLINSINQERKTLDSKKSDLEVKLKEAERTQLLYQQQQNDLAEQKNNKKVLLSGVDREKEKLQAALDELEQSSRNLESYIRSRRSGGGGGSEVGTGSMTWPCPGYTTVTSAYGMRYHPILKVRKLHTGVDLNAPGGAKIVAADSGTIICATWQTGYGKTIIIDHGNGTSTLYGHLDDYAVSDGETVKKGQTIGYADSTGWSTGNHLHFEVRINGSPTNPMSYL
ncbi:MAG: peptidoglycan DD-metalloendopeptidase family protein [Syntrophomonadaceae bacterium]